MTNEQIRQIVLESFNEEDALDDLGTILEHAEKACRKVRDLLTAGGPDLKPIHNGVEPQDFK